GRARAAAAVRRRRQSHAGPLRVCVMQGQHHGRQRAMVPIARGMAGAVLGMDPQHRRASGAQFSHLLRFSPRVRRRYVARPFARLVARRYAGDTPISVADGARRTDHAPTARSDPRFRVRRRRGISAHHRPQALWPASLRGRRSDQRFAFRYRSNQYRAAAAADCASAALERRRCARHGRRILFYPATTTAPSTGRRRRPACTQPHRSCPSQRIRPAYSKGIAPAGTPAAAAACSRFPVALQTALGPALDDAAGLVLLFAAFLLAAIGLVVDVAFRAYVEGLNRLAESARIIVTANPAHRLPDDGPAEVVRLAALIN